MGVVKGFTGGASGYYAGVNADAMAAINNGAHIGNYSDFMIAPGGQPMNIDPNDTIVGFKGEPPFAGKGTTINITGNNIYGVDADNIADALQKKLGNMISIC
jgi:hypothetical protein